MIKKQAKRRADTMRVVAKRMRIAEMFKLGADDDNPYKGREGHLKKFNLNCGCKLCKHYKHIGNAKGSVKHSDLKKIKSNEYEEH